MAKLASVLKSRMFMRIVICAIIVAAMAGAQSSLLTAQDPITGLKGATDPKSVIGKTFEVWYTGVPGNPAVHDCWTFTQTEMCSAGCGACGPLRFDSGGPVGHWIGTFPCPQPSVVMWIGTSVDAPPIGDVNVAGASGIQIFLDGSGVVWNWGGGAVEHPDCTHVVSEDGGGYSK